MIRVFSSGSGYIFQHIRFCELRLMSSNSSQIEEPQEKSDDISIVARVEGLHRVYFSRSDFLKNQILGDVWAGCMSLRKKGRTPIR